jgi:hypothetical protein
MKENYFCWSDFRCIVVARALSVKYEIQTPLSIVGLKFAVDTTDDIELFYLYLPHAVGPCCTALLTPSEAEDPLWVFDRIRFSFHLYKAWRQRRLLMLANLRLNILHLLEVSEANL